MADQVSKGCLEYPGPSDKDGYGRIYVGGKRIRAHRNVWENKFGKIQRGLCVLHKCDNRKCCNTDHLFLGTRKENAKDRNDKNRQASKENNGQHKLTEDNVLDAKILRKRGYTWAALGRIYGVCHTTIRSACFGRTWKNGR